MSRSHVRLPASGWLIPAWLALALLACGAPGEDGPRGGRSGGRGPGGSLSQGRPPAPSVEIGLSLFREGDYEAAEPRLLEALRGSPRDARILEALGSIYARTDRLRRAEESFREALEIRPDSVDARLGLAGVWIDSGRYEDALEVVEAVLRRHPDNVDAGVRRALLLLRRGRPAEAESAARQVLARRPEHAEARYVLGLSLLRQGRLEGASIELRGVLERSPHHLGALGNLISVEMRLGRPGEAESFRRRHRQALRRVRVEERVRGRRLAAVAAFNREDYPTALRELRAIAREDPGDAQVHLYLGSTHIALGDYRAAREALERSLSLEARSERALMELGRLDALEGRLDEAVDALLRAIEVNPQFAEPHYFLAGVYMARGQPELYERQMRIYRDLRSRSPGSAMELAPGAPRERP
ncbi:MAG: tetratricopeptide repeat protein [Acidobacteriota bacterium]